MKVLIEGVEYVPAQPKYARGDVPRMHHLFANVRHRERLVLREVSEATGLSISTVCGAESGDAISLLTAIKLCRYYGIDLETLADSVETHGIPNAVPRTTPKRQAAGMGRST